MSVKSSVITPTNIGSEGNVGRHKGNTTSSKGPQYAHLPGSESYDNAQVNRRSVSGGVPAGAQKNSPGDRAGGGSGETSKPSGRQIDFLPKSYPGKP